MHALRRLVNRRPRGAPDASQASTVAWQALLLPVLLLLAAPPGAAATALARHDIAAAADIPGLGDPGKPLILLAGDSITAFGVVSGQDPAVDRRRFPDGNYSGWALRLNDTMRGTANIINLAAGGSSTKGLVQHLRRTLGQLRPRLRDVVLVTVCFGANDAVLPSRPSWHVPLANFTANLQQAVSMLHEAGISNVLLMTPPPVGVRHPTNPDRMNNLTAKYAGAVLQLGRTLPVPTADIFSALMAVTGWQSAVMQPDALHLNNAGNKVVYECVWAAMQRHFPHINPNSLVKRGVGV